MKMILFVVLFNALVFAKCGKIKRRSAEEDYCDDYDGDGPDPINKEFCYKLPLTSELCGDKKMPYKCCYYEYETKSGIKGKGCHEISKNTYDRINDYIEEKKKEQPNIDDLIMNCDPEQGKSNYIIASKLSLILLFF